MASRRLKILQHTQAPLQALRLLQHVRARLSQLDHRCSQPALLGDSHVVRYLNGCKQNGGGLCRNGSKAARRSGTLYFPKEAPGAKHEPANSAS